jgi:hypothetical protein
MLRADVRRAVGGKFREFVKSPHRPSNTTDAFEELLVHVYYAANGGMCEFIEFGGGSARPILHGKDLLSEPFSELRDWFRTLDPTMTEDATGLESPALGIGLYAPYADEEPDRPPEGVSVFKRGYRQPS